MSYNSRRSGSGYGSNQTQQSPNLGNVGQRRPLVTNNFVSGGQLASQQKSASNAQPSQQQQQQPQQQQTRQQTQQAATNLRNQSTAQQQKGPQQQQQQRPQQQQQQQQQQSKPQQQQQAQQQKVQPQTQQQQVQKQPQQQVEKPQQQQQQRVAASGYSTQPQVVAPEPASIPVPPQPMDESGEAGAKKKSIWANKANRISKKERLRRRNVRLIKMLQPKNAVMILNEMVRHCAYEVEEIPTKVDLNQFKATVVFDGESHVGLGRSKTHAKNSAAESAIKYLIKNKKLDLLIKKDGNDAASSTNNEDEAMPMDTSEEETSIVPWQQVASFALYKLFSSWGEDPMLNKVQELLGSAPTPTPNANKPHEHRPAKKLPDNPEQINPMMMVNQMLPNASFEEIGKSGVSPNVVFSYRCTVNGETFMGTGRNKKEAKKQAAYGVCHKILGINYPTDVYVPIY